MANFWSQRGNTALHQTTIYQLHSCTSSLFRDKMSAEWQHKGHDCDCVFRTTTERNTCKCFLEKVHRHAYGEVHLLKQTTMMWTDVMSFNSQHVMIAAPQCTWGLTTFLLSTHSLWGPGSSVGVATAYGLDGPGSNPGGDEIFRPSGPVLGSSQLPVKWLPDLSRG